MLGGARPGDQTIAESHNTTSKK